MWRYRLLLLILSLPLIAVSLWHAIRYRDLLLVLQRLGIALPRYSTKPVWIHAASVGEVNAVIPFIRLLQEKFPQQALLVSTNTATGKQVLKKHFPELAHTYLSFDWQFISSRFVKNVNPSCALIFETEIWPNLFASVAKQSIPLVIFNGRVSRKSLRGRQRFAGAYQYAFQQVSVVLARSPQDQQNFIALGAAADKVQTVGNIKYAAFNKTDFKPMDLSRPYILAASTRDGEEKFLVEALKGTMGKTLLVIAPRHPQRRAEIEKDLTALNIPFAVRSRNEPLNETTLVYLADTLGELNRFIAGAEFVLMGGAFLPFGGHNILEVAQQGKAVVFGSHMTNFNDEAKAFLEHNAAIQVNDQTQLRDAVQLLMTDTDKTRQLGENGKTLMVRNAEIAQTYLDSISHYCANLR